MGLSILATVVAVGVVLAAVVWLGGVYNGLVAAKHECDREWANIDVLLKQRHDELPKLVEVCKGYMAHERQTLEAVTAARERYSAAQTPAEAVQASSAISSALRQLFAVAENYPQLRAVEVFQQLERRVSDLEAQIADRRELYNAAANGWNVRIEQVPDRFVAAFMGGQPRELWKADPADREDVKLGLAG
ncbi:MAG TPA: LemA family protein [Myxococcales bacterium]|nr:LemA family protein [Myxococcales bacterium]